MCARTHDTEKEAKTLQGIFIRWPGKLAQVVECLLCKHEDPNSIPRTQLKSQAW